MTTWTAAVVPGEALVSAKGYKRSLACLLNHISWRQGYVDSTPDQQYCGTLAIAGIVHNVWWDTRQEQFVAQPL